MIGMICFQHPAQTSTKLQQSVGLAVGGTGTPYDVPDLINRAVVLEAREFRGESKSPSYLLNTCILRVVFLVATLWPVAAQQLTSATAVSFEGQRVSSVDVASPSGWLSPSFGEFGSQPPGHGTDPCTGINLKQFHSEPPRPGNSSNVIDVRTSGPDLSLSPLNLFRSLEWRFELDPIIDLFQTMEIVGVVHARLEATAPRRLKRDADVVEGHAQTTSPSRAHSLLRRLDGGDGEDHVFAPELPVRHLAASGGIIRNSCHRGWPETKCLLNRAGV
jgi:hypothetical protein